MEQKLEELGFFKARGFSLEYYRWAPAVQNTPPIVCKSGPLSLPPKPPNPSPPLLPVSIRVSKWSDLELRTPATPLRRRSRVSLGCTEGLVQCTQAWGRRWQRLGTARCFDNPPPPPKDQCCEKALENFGAEREQVTFWRPPMCIKHDVFHQCSHLICEVIRVWCSHP